MYLGRHPAMESLDVLVGTKKVAFLISGGHERSAWAVSGPFCEGWSVNRVTGDFQTGTIRVGDGGNWHGAGVWRGQMNDWVANDSGFDRMIGRTGEPLALRRQIPAELEPHLRPRHSLCRDQTHKSSGQPQSRCILGTGPEADLPSFGGQLAAGSSRAGPSHHGGTPDRPAANLGRNIRCGGVFDRVRRCDLGAPQPLVEPPGVRCDRPSGRSRGRRDRTLRA